MESVPDEDQGSGDRLWLCPARAEDRVAPQHQWIAVAVDQQSHERLFGDHAGDIEFHWLVVAVYTGWLQSHGVELRYDVLGGAQIAIRPRQSALHAVIGEYFDVRPPCLS